MPRNNFDFTSNAKHTFIRTISDLTSDTNIDSSVIYKQLEDNLNSIPFCDFLQRYIFLKTGMNGDYDSVPLSEYINILELSFQENNTPISFHPVATRKHTMFKNWLTQKSVHRNVVLLLAFGLQMDADDVNLFLLHALHEPGLNFRDPKEILCWYCYQKRYQYPRFLYLTEQLGQDHTVAAYPIGDLSTQRIRNTILHIYDDDELLSFLSSMYTEGNASKYHRTIQTWFSKLYHEAQCFIAELYTETELENAKENAKRYREKSSQSTRLYDFQKEKGIIDRKQKYRIYHPDDISGSDIERILYSGIPRDRHGNLLPNIKSSLYDQFQGKRLLRQNIHEILHEQREADRYDLLTLLFLVHCSKVSENVLPQVRLDHFIRDANYMLQECSMGNLYIANPYESFLLMCILSDEPLTTFGDIWEMSYQNELTGRQ